MNPYHDWAVADWWLCPLRKSVCVELRNPAGRWVSGTGPTLCEAVWKAYESLRFWAGGRA